MGTEHIHVGFGNMVALNRVIAVLSCEQEPAERIVREARDKGLLLDATHARKMKAARIMDTGHVAVVAISAETLSASLRYVKEEPPSEE
jgi:extracellular matrix regulatory protein A